MPRALNNEVRPNLEKTKDLMNASQLFFFLPGVCSSLVTPSSSGM